MLLKLFLSFVHPFLKLLPIWFRSTNSIAIGQMYCASRSIKDFYLFHTKKKSQQSPHYFLTSHLQQLIKFYLFFCYNVGPRTVRLVNIFDFHYCKTKGSLSCCNLSHLIVGRARPFTLCIQKLSNFFTKNYFR